MISQSLRREAFVMSCSVPRFPQDAQLELPALNYAVRPLNLAPQSDQCLAGARPIGSIALVIASAAVILQDPRSMRTSCEWPTGAVDLVAGVQSVRFNLKVELFMLKSRPHFG
jgi:hypothetical protein